MTTDPARCQKRRVDLLDEDAVVLHCLNIVRDLGVVRLKEGVN
jgi:hypothetical protein